MSKMGPEKIWLRFWDILGGQVQNDLKTLWNRLLGSDLNFFKNVWERNGPFCSNGWGGRGGSEEIERAFPNKQ